MGADLHGAPEIVVGLGGSNRRVQFADVELRLIGPDGSTAAPSPLSRFAQGFAIEDIEAFDRRFNEG